MVGGMTGKDIRRIVLGQSYLSGANHIGSSLSVADILADLYTSVIRGNGPDDPERDRFVLSKGHAAYALYAALELRGWLNPHEVIEAFEHEHPDHRTPGVEFSTGSLGMGITYAVGQAYALLRRGSSARVFCLISDAECQEGSVWEAAMLASRLGLPNLRVIVDENRQQALGHLPEQRLGEKFAAFGFTVHDHAHSLHAATLAAYTAHRPVAVIATTVSGDGVAFMEGELEWHYRSLDATTYLEAMTALG